MIIFERMGELKRGFTNEDAEYIVDYNNGYITDIFSQIADNAVGIYTKDLLEWLVDNYEELEEYVQEFGIDYKNFDLLGAIRGAQWLCYERQLSNEAEEICEFWLLDYLKSNGLEELSETQVDYFESINFSKFDTLEELAEEGDTIVANLF
jgi:hypothetical protein